MDLPISTITRHHPHHTTLILTWKIRVDFVLYGSFFVLVKYKCEDVPTDGMCCDTRRADHGVENNPEHKCC